MSAWMPRAQRRINFERLRALHAVGLNDVQIAERMGVSAGGVKDARSKFGLPPNAVHRSRKWTADRVRELHRLINNGVPVADIVQRMGCTRLSADAAAQRYLPVSLNGTKHGEKAARQAAREAAKPADEISGFDVIQEMRVRRANTRGCDRLLELLQRFHPYRIKQPVEKVRVAA